MGCFGKLAPHPLLARVECPCRGQPIRNLYIWQVVIEQFLERKQRECAEQVEGEAVGEGRPIRSSGTTQDITERKLAEAAQARLVEILEATPDFVGIADTSQHPTYLNRAGREMMGMTEDEDVSNTSILNHFTPLARSTVNEGVKAALRDGTWSGETTLLSRAGREIPVSQVIIAHKTEDGEVAFLSTVARDITGVKQAAEALRKANDELERRVAERTSELERANAALREEEAKQQQVMVTLKQSEERFRLLVESVHDYAILMLDATGHIMTWNSGAERMKGYQAENIIGQHFSCFYTPEDQEAGKPEQELRTAEAEGYLDDEGWRVRRDGSRFWATVVITALRDNTGKLRGFAKVSRDITERKNVEAALHEAKAQADKANLAKSEFLSRMSHELRTPLNAILGFGQILDGQDLTPRQHESIGYILKGGRHLLGLINEVLDIARVEAGHIDLSLEPVALHEVVPEVCALVRPLAAERHIHLKENSAELGRSYILADLQRFRQVLINILSNAIKYNRDPGNVEVLCAIEPEGWVSIAVRDTGPGISPQDLPKLFTPFERLGAAASSIEGTGLGLVLSQRLVVAMAGTLEVESVLGQGTTFTLKLPQTASPAEQVTNAHEEIRFGLSGEKVEHIYSVLCIEDNPPNLRLIEAILESRPEITLLSAMQGSVGLDLARQHNPDLILLDLDLPDIKGNELLVRLQQSAITRDIPVVIVSADATPGQIDRLLSAGAKAYLTKPLDVGQFLHTLDQFLAVPQDEESH